MFSSHEVKGQQMSKRCRGAVIRAGTHPVCGHHHVPSSDGTIIGLSVCLSVAEAVEEPEPRVGNGNLWKTSRVATLGDQRSRPHQRHLTTCWVLSLTSVGVARHTHTEGRDVCVCESREMHFS